MTFDDWMAERVTRDPLVWDRHLVQEAWEAATERAAKIAEADPNPCPICNYIGERPDFRGKGIAAAIRGAKP